MEQIPEELIFACGIRIGQFRWIEKKKKKKNRFVPSLIFKILNICVNIYLFLYNTYHMHIDRPILHILFTRSRMRGNFHVRF